VIAGTGTDYSTARAPLEASVALSLSPILTDCTLLVLTLACLDHPAPLGANARVLCRESLDLARWRGDRWLIAWSLRHLGEAREAQKAVPVGRQGRERDRSMMGRF
jgi:hypothetical protein